MSAAPGFVLVGHCGPDVFMLKTAVGRAFPGAGAVVEMANDDHSIGAHVDAGRVLLVNRVLDGRFQSRSGVELIRSILSRQPGAVTMLVSNHEDAQEEAVAAGARPGFGKRELYDERTMQLLRDAVTSK